MKTLTIKDLSVSTELDRKAMSAVRGGESYPVEPGGGNGGSDIPYIPDVHNLNYREFFKSLGIDFPF